MSSNDTSGAAKPRDPKTSQQSSTSSKASQQPPFPISGTAPDKRDPPPAHPNAEHLINTAARHIVPDVPAPVASEEEDKAAINKPGKDEDQREEREQEPLLRGTPLDELLTPGIGIAPEPQMTQLDRKDSSDTLDAPERQETKVVHSKDRPQTRQQPGRPGFGAMRGVGSDSVSHRCAQTFFPSSTCSALFHVVLPRSEACDYTA